jgi:RNA polymerase sigma-54 factor
LQQAIRLLQLNRIELRDYVQELVDANPLLDQEDPLPADEPLQTDDTRAGEAAGPESSDRESSAEGDEYFSDDFDSGEWQPPAESEPWAENAGWSEDFGERQFADTSGGSLREHLLRQILLAHFSEQDAAIARAIIYALDDDGFLADSIDEIRASLLPELLVSDDEVLAVLHRVQRLEPVGVASRDTGECIRLQLQAQPSGTPGAVIANRLARDYLDLVAANDFPAMLKVTGASPDELKAALELIHGLEPRPGARYDNRHDEYIVPDVYVRCEGDNWVATLSPESNPSLKLNKYYISLLRKSGGKDAEYLRARLQEARWLLSSLELRNQTLLKVSQCIVDKQKEFLNEGEIAMKPLVLNDVAEAVGVHESTVSRATTHKYMLTPRGIFELKYFFSSHVRTTDGGRVSATAIKARIQLMIENEPHEQPLSDQELSRLLREMHICAARRTVAKYREALGIGSSSERRRNYRREMVY